MPPLNPSADQANDHLSILDDVILRPFPDKEGRPDANGQWGGPGFHLAVLRESQDFWEDRSTEIVDAAEGELAADLAALAVVLTARWGAPQTIDLRPYLGLDDPGYPGNEAPEPLSYLSNVAMDMQVWRVPSAGRWLGLTIGQGDRELPFELLAAVGESSAPPR
ncbi:hypothetical protein WDV06_23530 [Streptomyces racemochromogenes]|uniref:Uncharacterized protein n=1 Tax=Streptomyces racemochromogenes TaxID=67353 RepID=A0ABW7PI24_9ACTN